METMIAKWLLLVFFFFLTGSAIADKESREKEANENYSFKGRKKERRMPNLYLGG